jgi:endonuclease YncB( thermonuclease family)
MRGALPLLGLLLGLLLAGTETAWAQPAGLTPLPAAALRAVEADFTLLLEDGRRLRLAGIELPRRPLADPSPQPWPLEQAARAVLDRLRDQPLTLLAATDSSADRWGRLPVQVVRADGRWVQDELLRQGLARVATSPDDRTGAALLLAAEAPARQSTLGLWGDPAMALRRPEETPRLVDSRQVVEGLITSVHAGRSDIFLNMGEDWRRGLGVRLSRRLAATLPGDPQTLAGRRIRVRGWIGKASGPILTLSHAEQMEVIGGWP